GIAAAMGRTGTGVFEAISDFVDIDAEFSLLRRMVEVSGRPLSLSLMEGVPGVDWRDLLGRISAARAEGLPMSGQVAARPIGSVSGLQGDRHAFAWLPA